MNSTRAPDTAVECYDPDCFDDTGRRSTAEPEQDGDLRYHACTMCGYTFGYIHVTSYTLQVDPAGVCSVGVPEGIRLAASAPMRTSIAADQPGPLLSIGRRHGHTAA
jgi:hypothetical protein